MTFSLCITFRFRECIDIDRGAARLQYICKKHRLSQRELAKRAGVTNGTISMSLAEFFTFEVEANRTVVSRRAEMPNLGNEQIDFYLAGASVKGRNMGIMREVRHRLMRVPDELR
ncbi:transcriptional regulator, XRE family with cupin sensor domain [Paraburkholderia phymatum STM815]|uniref:Transcriptional regulator, XRE family with cupin sensor domain n=1 Tax=Paraburkholderia phymatum (strain DSM 17167 / CIP 108236 / LMG 21445 / STM815) TaxID=391038 RepID=B2JM17_PARP8|nr:transcriptional regulator, XRE family with cupin sensor domain [Paraburkholderia phymatum STM815]